MWLHIAYIFNSVPQSPQFLPTDLKDYFDAISLAEGLTNVGYQASSV